MKQTATFTLRSLRSFAQQHDDLPAFHAAYLLLTFLAAALFNLGFFAMLIVFHMVLDVFKYRDVHGFGWKRTIEGMLRESFVEIALLLMGLVVAVYLHPSLTGMIGIKGMMLAEITVLRSVGILTPKLKILYDLIGIMSNIDNYLNRLHPRMSKHLSLIEYVCAMSIVISLAMLIVAPILLMLTSGQYAFILLDELTPWRF